MAQIIFEEKNNNTISINKITEDHIILMKDITNEWYLLIDNQYEKGFYKFLSLTTETTKGNSINRNKSYPSIREAILVMKNKDAMCYAFNNMQEAMKFWLQNIENDEK